MAKRRRLRASTDPTWHLIYQVSVTLTTIGAKAGFECQKWM